MIQSPSTFGPCIDILQRQTGVVIPVYLSPKIDTGLAELLLNDTVAAYCAQSHFPENVCLSVDGAPFGAEVASRIAAQFGASLTVSPQNKGKLWAAVQGVGKLSQSPCLKYIAIVDQDGDHFANELLNLIRVAEHIAGQVGHNRVLVLGQRSSRHRPMGFLRGELEELANRVLLDALHYHAAMMGIPLCLEYATSLAEYPDFHSGYKLFSLQTARHVFLTEPNQVGVSDDCYYRHAVEAVMTVEALENGAFLGVVNRSTINEQPVSTFGTFDAGRLMADTILWPCKRLNVPFEFVMQWLDNHIPRLLLATLSPEGKQELLRLRQLVFEDYGGKPDDDHVFAKPLFV